MSSSISTRGTVRVLFKSGPAQIMRMDLDEEFAFKVIRVGEFIVNLVTGAKASMSSWLLMCVCMVGHLQRPIAKDSPIIRIGWRSFALACQGCFMAFSSLHASKNTEHTIDTLARVFNKFGTYKDLNENETDITGYPFLDNESDLWYKLRSLVFPMAEEELARLGHIPRIPGSPSLRNQASGNLRMIRMSAATKMISNVVVSGSVISKHIFIQKTIPEENVHASIVVFSNLVGALEVSRAIASGHDNLVAQSSELINYGPAALNGSQAFKAWELTQEGHVYFLQVLGPLADEEHAFGVK